ncbi:MAG: hypothetical protein K5985_12460 [Lachnospiraceae bacterium]|nr:hypothetical protein [Lachnospiraceae bacterium]
MAGLFCFSVLDGCTLPERLVRAAGVPGAGEAAGDSESASEPSGIIEIPYEGSDPWQNYEIETDTLEIGDESFSEREEGEGKGEGGDSGEADALYRFSGENNYCFSLLGNDEKRVYIQMFNCFFNMESDVILRTLDLDEVDKCFNYVLLDHPELFFVEGYKTVVTKRGGVPIKLSVSGKYGFTASERAAAQKKIDAKVTEILSGVPDTEDEYEKVRYIFDYIVNNTDYDADSENNQNIVSVFVNGKSVCQGYSMAVKYLLDRMGIFCTLVYGYAGGENHSWNLVKVNGTYCYLDTTWGDAAYRDHEEKNKTYRTNYNYLGADDEILKRTHKISSPAPTPKCESLEEYYFVRENSYFTEVDMLRLQALFERVRSEGEDILTIKCADNTVYDRFISELFYRKKISDFYEPGQTTSYIRDDMEYTISFTSLSENREAPAQVVEEGQVVVQ